MKQFALARQKHDENIAPRIAGYGLQSSAYVRTVTTTPPVHMSISSKQHSPHTPLRLSSLIGNRAMQRVFAPQIVQRSLWDDVTDTVNAASEWISGNNEISSQTSWENEAQPDDSNVGEDALEHSNEPEFQNAVDADLDTAPDQTSSGSWFDSFLSGIQSEQEEFLTDNEQTDANTNANTDRCLEIEQELDHVQRRVEDLFDQSQNMLPALEAAKAAYEALKKSEPGSAKTQSAKERFDRLHAEYNQVVEECLQLMAYRDQLRADLAACKENEKKKMPKGFPCC